MKERRWLLPFTYRVNSEALDLVCQMAQEANATLVAISLLAPRPGKGIQIEEIQESRARRLTVAGRSKAPFSRMRRRMAFSSRDRSCGSVKGRS